MNVLSFEVDLVLYRGKGIKKICVAGRTSKPYASIVHSPKFDHKQKYQNKIYILFSIAMVGRLVSSLLKGPLSHSRRTL